MAWNMEAHNPNNRTRARSNAGKSWFAWRGIDVAVDLVSGLLEVVFELLL